MLFLFFLLFFGVVNYKIRNAISWLVDRLEHKHSFRFNKFDALSTSSLSHFPQSKNYRNWWYWRWLQKWCKRNKFQAQSTTEAARVAFVRNFSRQLFQLWGLPQRLWHELRKTLTELMMKVRSRNANKLQNQHHKTLKWTSMLRLVDESNNFRVKLTEKKNREKSHDSIFHVAVI